MLFIDLGIIVEKTKSLVKAPFTQFTIASLPLGISLVLCSLFHGHAWPKKRHIHPILHNCTTNSSEDIHLKSRIPDLSARLTFQSCCAPGKFSYELYLRIIFQKTRSLGSVIPKIYSGLVDCRILVLNFVDIFYKFSK